MSKKYYYVVKCKQCDITYRIETDKTAFDTFQVAEEKKAACDSKSFIHACKDHWLKVPNTLGFGVAEIIGIEYMCEKVAPINIGADGRCTCGVGDKCPLGKVGHPLLRCTREELINAGIPVFVEEA